MVVPVWWAWVSALYFIVSTVFICALCGALFVLYLRVMPVLKEAQIQVRRVSSQAKAVAVKASNTADIVHAQTQHLLGNAQSAGNQVTRQARTVGAALTGLLVAARVVSFVRKAL